MSPGITKSASTSEIQDSKLYLIQANISTIADCCIQCINSILEVFRNI